MRQTTIADLLEKFDITSADLDRVRAAGVVLKPRLDEFIEAFYDWMAKAPEFKVFFGAHPGRLERVKPMQRANWVSFLDANIDDAWINARKHVGQVHAHIDLPNDIYFAGMSTSTTLMVQQLRRQCTSQPWQRQAPAGRDRNRRPQLLTYKLTILSVD